MLVLLCISFIYVVYHFKFWPSVFHFHFAQSSSSSSHLHPCLLLLHTVSRILYSGIILSFFIIFIFLLSLLHFIHLHLDLHKRKDILPTICPFQTRLTREEKLLSLLANGPEQFFLSFSGQKHTFTAHFLDGIIFWMEIFSVILFRIFLMPYFLILQPVGLLFNCFIADVFLGLFEYWIMIKQQHKTNSLAQYLLGCLYWSSSISCHGQTKPLGTALMLWLLGGMGCSVNRS